MPRLLTVSQTRDFSFSLACASDGHITSDDDAEASLRGASWSQAASPHTFADVCLSTGGADCPVRHDWRSGAANRLDPREELGALHHFDQIVLHLRPSGNANCTMR